jgi:hypothetical protein
VTEADVSQPFKNESNQDDTMIMDKDDTEANESDHHDRMAVTKNCAEESLSNRDDTIDYGRI